MGPKQRWRVAVMAISLSVLGCERGDGSAGVSEKLEALMAKTERQLENLGSTHQEVCEVASSEVQKLFNYEYKLVALVEESGRKGIEAALNELGQDRWDCFQVVPVEGQLTAVCKRRPKTPLRYIPRMIP